ncbi:MAG: hypothetical protein ACOC5T_03725 [Elusimicrobiota bacterium]
MRLSIKKKRKQNKTAPKRRLLWSDPVTGELVSFETHWLDYIVVNDEFIETKNNKFITIDSAIKKYIDKNPGLDKAWAEYFVRKNHEIIKKRRIRAIPKVVEEKNEDNSNIYKWIKDYKNYNNTSMEVDIDDNDNIVISFKDVEADDVLYQLDRHNLYFDILE